MWIRVLGSAAGGGFPQWNCGCANCRGVREKTIRATARTQESVAVSASGDAWVLLNASPEIRQQIESFEPLHPRGPRHSPIAAIVLTNGDLDHCLGVLSLRESHPITVYATDQVRRGFIEKNVLYRTLERFPGQVTWRRLVLGHPQDVVGADAPGAGAPIERHAPIGLSVEAIAVPGKPPVHLEDLPASPEDSVGLLIRDAVAGVTLAYFSGVGEISPAVADTLAGADCVFFDGTFWSSDELTAGGLGTKRAEQMAHLPVGGPDGSLARLTGLSAVRKILIHVNNTNPVLREDSRERARVEAADWEIAYDGMEITL